MPTISESNLLRLAQDLLQTGGLPPEAAAVVADSLVQANLRGHDSHGVMRIPFYVAKVKDGSVNPRATLTLEKDHPAVIVADGGWGLGQVLVRDLMSRLICKAKTTGIACGTLRRAAHIGRLGEYAELAAKDGMASMICANTHGAAQRVAPVGGKRPRLGTNPLCLGMPGGAQGPFIFDIGTSATAEGKVRVKRIAGQPVPSGWILDPDGNPTTDPNQLYGDPPGSILPMGGDQAYKGFGLAYMIEMLSGGLSGGQCAMPNGPPPRRQLCVLRRLESGVLRRRKPFAVRSRTAGALRPRRAAGGGRRPDHAAGRPGTEDAVAAQGSRHPAGRGQLERPVGSGEAAKRVRSRREVKKL